MISKYKHTRHRDNVPVVLCFILVMVTPVGPIQAGSVVSKTYLDNLAIEGYDPVAYFTMSKPIEGSPDFTHEYLGAEWRFANAEHQRMFKAEPIKYVPQHGGYCSAAAAGGETSIAYPQNWRIIEGKLYLFAGDPEQFDPNEPSSIDAKSKWEKQLLDLVSQ